MKHRVSRVETTINQTQQYHDFQIFVSSVGHLNPRSASNYARNIYPRRKSCRIQARATGRLPFLPLFASLSHFPSRSIHRSKSQEPRPLHPKHSQTRHGSEPVQACGHKLFNGLGILAHGSAACRSLFGIVSSSHWKNAIWCAQRWTRSEWRGQEHECASGG